MVTPFAQGALNKLYTVDAPGVSYLIRVALPVVPRLKTLSEIATIEFVRKHASGLVPRVLAYDANVEVPNSREIGLEWMIMERLPGNVLKECWDGMDWETKVLLVKTLVGILAQLYDHPLSGIGNIYPNSASCHLSTIIAEAEDLVPSSSVVGQIVSMMFFWDGRLEQDVPRGPFRSSHDWLAACLQLTLNDAARSLSDIQEDEDSDAEDEHEKVHETQAISERLLRLLPRIFLPLSTNSSSETTIIHHGDLSYHNLLVDSSGLLTGIVDWECVSALPLWRACTLPSFLSGRSRDDKPNVNQYASDDDGRTNELYFDHMIEWEQTQLRVGFFEEMMRAQPQWVGIYRESVLKEDFLTAITLCSDALSRSGVRRWVARMEAMKDEQLQGGPIVGDKNLADTILM